MATTTNNPKGTTTMHSTKISVEEMRRLVRSTVTLDGKPASLIGMNDSAIVMSKHGSYEWAWPTVRRIVDERNGSFKS
jgi:hypothetical protein